MRKRCFFDEEHEDAYGIFIGTLVVSRQKRRLSATWGGGFDSGRIDVGKSKGKTIVVRFTESLAGDASYEVFPSGTQRPKMPARCPGVTVKDQMLRLGEHMDFYAYGQGGYVYLRVTNVEGRALVEDGVKAFKTQQFNKLLTRGCTYREARAIIRGVGVSRVEEVLVWTEAAILRLDRKHSLFHTLLIGALQGVYSGEGPAALADMGIPLPTFGIYLEPEEDPTDAFLQAAIDYHDVLRRVSWWWWLDESPQPVRVVS
jgi:hypothetical protein